MSNIKKKLNLKFIAFFVLFFAMPLSIVYANYSTGGEGNNDYNSCAYDFCYSGSGGDGHGLRLSLYEYKNGQITYYGARDFCTGGNCFNGKIAQTTYAMAGRIAYQYGKASLSFGNTATLNPNTTTKFACYNGLNCSYVSGADVEINNLFKLGSNNYESIQNAIKNVFGIFIDDLTYTYITIEPTVFFYKSGGAHFYGTVYELLQTGNNGGIGMWNVIRIDTPNSVRAQWTSGNDDNCFIGTSNCSSSLITLVSEGNEQAVKQGMDGTGGYGINVIWVGSPKNTPPRTPSCERSCGGKTGRDLLSCAENYCQANSKDSNSKKNCIKSCGYTPSSSELEFSKCSDKSDSNGDNTVCDGSTKATQKTCVKATTSTYYKSTCEEVSTIQYGNSLPVTVSPGLGFSYTPTVSGSKYCRNEFETKKWEFDYAASYTKAERDVLKGILNNYNSTTSATWTADRFKYSSSKGTNIEIEITNDNDLSAKNRTTTKKLVTAQKDIDNKYEVSTEDNASIVTMYESLNKTSKNVARAVLTNSSNRSIYQLPAVCIAVGSGDIYEPTNNKCKSSSEGPYYDYYTNLKIKVDSYDTKTTVTKEGTALNVTNTCNYNVNAPVSCAIVYKDGTYELRIENKNSVPNISYGLSFSQNSLNGQKSYTGGLDRTLYGTVAIGSQIVATCKALSNVPDNSTCGGFLPAEYDKIKSYCATSWMNDVVGFSSEKDCINYCGAGSNTCKNNPEIDNTNLADVTKFCTNASSRSEAGYNNKIYNNPVKDEKHNIAMCINDCMDMPKSNDCLGITCDYIYRPISLRDPFPNNRRPGYNWYGKEIYITDDLLNPVLNPNGTEPEYVISLNKDRMDTINKDTDTYNATKGNNAYLDYVYIDENNKSNAYVSKFIHQRGESKGGYNNYFTGGTLVNK